MSLASEISVELPPYEVAGPPDAPGIVVLGGISANRHVCHSAANRGAGWWDSVAGEGRALDTCKYRILGVDFLDGGETSEGRPARTVTTHDQADAVAAALDDLGIDRLHVLVGASYGGMVGLAFAERYPDRLDQLVVISAAHRSHPLVTARRVIQRRIIELGLEMGRVPEAVALARGLAMTTYRGARGFSDRFDASNSSRQDMLGAITAYLDHHGEKFARAFSAARFLALSLSSDLHAVEPAQIRTHTTVVAAEGDAVVPRDDLEQLARNLAAPCTLVDLASSHGHDAFLTEPEALGAILHNTLNSSRLS